MNSFRSKSNPRAFAESTQNQKMKKNTLAEYLESVRFPNKKQNKRDAFGIGIDPYDSTVGMPGIVHSRADLNRNTCYSNESWKHKGNQPAGIDMDCPQSFPLRQYLDYVKKRYELAMETESSRKPIERPCKNLENEKEEDLEKKKQIVEERKALEIEGIQLIKDLRIQTIEEIKMATKNDLLNCQKRVQDIIENVVKPKKIIRQIPVVEKVKQPEVIPLYVLEQPKNEPEIQQKIGDDKKELQTPTKPLHVNLANEINQTSSSPKNEKAKKEAIPIVQQSDEVYFTKKEVQSAQSETITKEMGVLMAKAFCFGDDMPRNVKISEYKDFYIQMKLESRSFDQFLTENHIRVDDSISLPRLKELLIQFRLKQENEEQLKRIKEVLAKNIARKSRVEKIERKIIEEQEESEHESESELQDKDIEVKIHKRNKTTFNGTTSQRKQIFTNHIKGAKSHKVKVKRKEQSNEATTLDKTKGQTEKKIANVNANVNKGRKKLEINSNSNTNINNFAVVSEKKTKSKNKRKKVSGSKKQAKPLSSPKNEDNQLKPKFIEENPGNCQV